MKGMTELPRLPALWTRPWSKWRWADQPDPCDYQEKELVGDPSWWRHFSSVADSSDKVKDVFDDQSGRGQVLELTEHEARQQDQDRVVV